MKQCIFCGKPITNDIKSYSAGQSDYYYCESCSDKKRLIAKSLLSSDDELKKAIMEIVSSSSSPIPDVKNAIYSIIKSLDPFFGDDLDTIIGDGFSKEELLKHENAYKQNEAKAEYDKVVEQKNTASKESEKFRRYFANFIISTTPTIQNRTIAKYIGVVDAEVVMGTGYISEFSASISDFFGAPSTAMANKLSSVKQTALNKLKEKCISAGANACVGVDFDIMTLGSNMLVASASGTAVVLADEEKEE